MAIKKPVTTDDIRVAAPTAPEGYTVLVSPIGSETTVPDSIKQPLLDAGYTTK